MSFFFIGKYPLTLSNLMNQKSQQNSENQDFITRI